MNGNGHFWSSDKDGGHIIQSAVVTNHMLHANLLQNQSYGQSKFYTAGIEFFDVFRSRDLDQMTFNTNLTHIAKRDMGCANINFLCQGF